MWQRHSTTPAAVRASVAALGPAAHGAAAGLHPAGARVSAFPQGLRRGAGPQCPKDWWLWPAGYGASRQCIWQEARQHLYHAALAARAPTVPQARQPADSSRSPTLSFPTPVFSHPRAHAPTQPTAQLPERTRFYRSVVLTPTAPFLPGVSKCFDSADFCTMTIT